MRILHLIPRFIGGGPERALLALIGAWRVMGIEAEHEIRVLDAPLSAPLIVKARALGARLVGPMRTGGRPDMDALGRAVHDADVVIVHFWNHPHLLEVLREPWPAARVLLRLAIRGTTPPHVLTAELAAFADWIVASSPRTLLLPAVGQAGVQAEWMPGLADMSRLDGFVPRAHEGIRIGHVGLIDPAKLHPRFAELCAAVARPEARFDVFGGGRVEALRARFDDLGLAGRAVVHGPTEDIAAALAGCDIVGHPLAPGSSATSEKSVQEAMWVGLPVVVLAGSGPEDLIEHGVTGLVARDEDDYPRQLERLIDDGALRATLGAAASGFAREHCDPVRNARRLLESCEVVLGGAKRARAPLAGTGMSAAARFVLTLGDEAGPFAVALGGAERHGAAAVAEAERAIAQSSAVVTQGEGGVIHHRNTYPDDPHLLRWSGLIAQAAGHQELAASEFTAAEIIWSANPPDPRSDP